MAVCQSTSEAFPSLLRNSSPKMILRSQTVGSNKVLLAYSELKSCGLLSSSPFSIVLSFIIQRRPVRGLALKVSRGKAPSAFSGPEKAGQGALAREMLLAKKIWRRSRTRIDIERPPSPLPACHCSTAALHSSPQAEGRLCSPTLPRWRSSFPAERYARR